MNAQQKALQKRLAREAKEAQAALETFEATVDPEAKAKASATIGEGESQDVVRLPRTRLVGHAVASRARKMGRGVIDTDLRDIGHAVRSIVPTVKVGFKGDDETTEGEEGNVVALVPDDITDPVTV